jgi:hypothetical protein
MVRKRLPEPFSISVTVDGKRFSGYYVLESDVVTVTYGSRCSSMQIGGSTARLVAGMLLRGLAHAPDKNQAD